MDQDGSGSRRHHGRDTDEVQPDARDDGEGMISVFRHPLFQYAYTYNAELDVVKLLLYGACTNNLSIFNFCATTFEKYLEPETTILLLFRLPSDLRQGQIDPIFMTTSSRYVDSLRVFSKMRNWPAIVTEYVPTEPPSTPRSPVDNIISLLSPVPPSTWCTFAFNSPLVYHRRLPTPSACWFLCRKVSRNFRGWRNVQGTVRRGSP